MLPEERFKSLCRLQRPGARLVPLGRRVLVAALSSWSRGALQGPGRRMPSHSQYCFHVKDNTFVVGFRLGRPPGKQQGPGSQRLPSPALPDLHWRAGCQNGLRAFLSIGAVGLVLLREECYLSLCRLQGPGTRLVPLASWGICADWPRFCRAVLLGHGRRRPRHVPSCFPAKENT